MATHNSSGSDPVTPSDSAHATMNGNGGSSNGSQPTQGAIADAVEKSKTTILVSPASAASSSEHGRQRWLVVALLLTSVAAGLGGAALGWSIRHQSQNPQAKDPPSLLDPFVNNEQSFPPIEGWAGDDAVAPYSSERFSEEAPLESLPRIEPEQERWSPESAPIQTRRPSEAEFVDPLELPPLQDPVWAAPDAVPVEPPAEAAPSPPTSSFPSEPIPDAAPEPPPPADASPLSESIRKSKPGAAAPEQPPRQSQSVDIPVPPAPDSLSSP